MTTANTISETTACPKCGADVRPGSLFCYNCGGRVKKEVSALVENERPKPKENVTQPAPGLRSAKDLRRRERVFDRAPRRIKWEPVEETSDVQLIVVTAAIVIFTVIVIALAFYLR
jgi:zinc-ribbon domain